MRRALTVLAALTATMVAVVAATPAAQASTRRASIAVWDDVDHEFLKSCIDSPPYPCNVISATSLLITIQVTNRPRPNAPISVNYQIINNTTTAADYTVAATGTLTIPSNAAQVYLIIPIVNDGVAEATETLTVRLTGASIPANISDTGIGTIHDGSQIPNDCSLARISDVEKSLTCSSRPATQTWRLNALCVAFGIVGTALGNPVTGNGTSTARCTEGGDALNTAFQAL